MSMSTKPGYCRASNCLTRLFQEDGSMLLGVTVVLHRGIAFCSDHGREIAEVEANLGPAITELHAHALVMSSPSLSLDVIGDYQEALRRVRRLRSMEKNLLGG